MIAKLRRRFVLIAMTSLLVLLVLLCITVSVGSYFAMVNRLDNTISILRENDGEIPVPPDREDPALQGGFQVTAETPFETRYFIVKLTAQQEVSSVDIEHIAAVDRQTVVECIGQILDSGDSQGFHEYYRFRIFSEEDGDSVIIVLDCFQEMQMVWHTFWITALASLGLAFLVFLLLVFSSRQAVRPYAENLEKQRRFVTDASHELKTPLTILTADLSLLGDMYGDNQWLDSARSQAVRLDRLIKNLVELARTEEAVKEEAVTLFSVSDVCQASVEGFQPLAEADGKALTAEIAPSLALRGVQDNFFRLFSILLDNAVKYCDAGGTIHLTLDSHGRTLTLSVSNPCRDADPAGISRWFDRFYRADSSRARSTGGYGIGLSTARAIVTRHRGRISARCSEGTVTLNATFPGLVRTGRSRQPTG